MYAFQKKNTFFETLHPITLIIYVFIVVFGAIMITNPLMLFGLLFAVFFMLKAGNSFDDFIKHSKIYFYMILVLFSINLLVNNLGATTLWSGPILPVFGRINITQETLVFGLVMSLRLLIIFSAFILYNKVIDPDKALSVFSKVFPRSALLLTLTTKTIPFMRLELQRAAEVQQCRGVKYHTGSFIERLKSRFPLIKVLFLSSLEDSFNLGESIQARAYGSGPRSSYYVLVFNVRDIILLSSSIISLLMLIWAMFWGWTAVEFFPRTGDIVVSKGHLLMIVTVTFLFVLPGILAWGWEKWTYLRLKI